MHPNPLAPICEAPDSSAHVPLRVLVVDDNENLRKTTVWLVEACGDPVESAPDGQAALAVARIFKPDVVLLDIGMPGMNGLEVCEALRRDSALRHVKVIALTGDGDAVMRRRTAQAGFDLHLTKPVEPTMLMEMLGLIRHSLTPRRAD